MSTEDNKAIVRWFFEEVQNQGNVAVVDELFAPNILLHFDFPSDVPVPAEMQLSLEEIKQDYSQFRTAFPDFHYTIELQVAEGDMVVTRGTARGKGMPPTGKQVTWTETWIFRIADGKFAEFWSNEDDMGRLIQIGALPTPGQSS